MYGKRSIRNLKIEKNKNNKKKKNRKEINNNVYSFNKLIYLVLAA